MGIEVYGLLHLNPYEKSAVNIVTESFQDQIQLYLKNAITLSNSLKAQGIPFTLLTNEKDAVEELLSLDKRNLALAEIPFTVSVPSGARFFSAHFKLDVFRYFSTLDKEYVALCDLDVICINAIPICLSRLIKNGIPICYDISDQVIPAYGQEVILRDLDTILGFESEGRWAGGEFNAGRPGYFLDLIKEADAIYDNYTRNIGTFHHTGDEPIVSAALEVLRSRGYRIADGGTLGIIGRYWRGRTLHIQKPLEAFRHCFLLHLPSDKRFLASLADEGKIENKDFFHRYYVHRNRLKRGIHRLKTAIRQAL